MNSYDVDGIETFTEFVKKTKFSIPSSKRHLKFLLELCLYLHQKLLVIPQEKKKDFLPLIDEINHAILFCHEIFSKMTEIQKLAPEFQAQIQKVQDFLKTIRYLCENCNSFTFNSGIPLETQVPLWKKVEQSFQDNKIFQKFLEQNSLELPVQGDEFNCNCNFFQNYMKKVEIFDENSDSAKLSNAQKSGASPFLRKEFLHKVLKQLKNRCKSFGFEWNSLSTINNAQISEMSSSRFGNSIFGQHNFSNSNFSSLTMTPVQTPRNFFTASSILTSRAPGNTTFRAGANHFQMGEVNLFLGVVGGVLGSGTTSFSLELCKEIEKQIAPDFELHIRCESSSRLPPTTLEIMQKIIAEKKKTCSKNNFLQQNFVHNIANLGQEHEDSKENEEEKKHFFPKTEEEIFREYHSLFAGRNSLIFIEDPASTLQLLELLPNSNFFLSPIPSAANQNANNSNYNVNGVSLEEEIENLEYDLENGEFTLFKEAEKKNTSTDQNKKEGENTPPKEFQDNGSVLKSNIVRRRNIWGNSSAIVIVSSPGPICCDANDKNNHPKTPKNSGNTKDEPSNNISNDYTFLGLKNITKNCVDSIGEDDGAMEIKESSFEGENISETETFMKKAGEKDENNSNSTDKKKSEDYTCRIEKHFVEKQTVPKFFFPSSDSEETEKKKEGSTRCKAFFDLSDSFSSKSLDSKFLQLLPQNFYLLQIKIGKISILESENLILSKSNFATTSEDFRTEFSVLSEQNPFMLKVASVTFSDVFSKKILKNFSNHSQILQVLQPKTVDNQENDKEQEKVPKTVRKEERKFVLRNESEVLRNMDFSDLSPATPKKTTDSPNQQETSKDKQILHAIFAILVEKVTKQYDQFSSFFYKEQKEKELGYTSDFQEKEEFNRICFGFFLNLLEIWPEKVVKFLMQICVAFGSDFNVFEACYITRLSISKILKFLAIFQKMGIVDVIQPGYLFKIHDLAREIVVFFVEMNKNLSTNQANQGISTDATNISKKTSENANSGEHSTETSKPPQVAERASKKFLNFFQFYENLVNLISKRNSISSEMNNTQESSQKLEIEIVSSVKENFIDYFSHNLFIMNLESKFSPFFNDLSPFKQQRPKNIPQSQLQQQAKIMQPLHKRNGSNSSYSKKDIENNIFSIDSDILDKNNTSDLGNYVYMRRIDEELSNVKKYIILQMEKQGTFGYISSLNSIRYFLEERIPAIERGKMYDSLSKHFSFPLKTESKFSDTDVAKHHFQDMEIAKKNGEKGRKIIKLKENQFPFVESAKLMESLGAAFQDLTDFEKASQYFKKAIFFLKKHKKQKKLIRQELRKKITEEMEKLKIKRSADEKAKEEAEKLLKKQKKGKKNSKSVVLTSKNLLAASHEIDFAMEMQLGLELQEIEEEDNDDIGSYLLILFLNFILGKINFEMENFEECAQFFEKVVRKSKISKEILQSLQISSDGKVNPSNFPTKAVDNFTSPAIPGRNSNTPIRKSKKMPSGSGSHHSKQNSLVDNLPKNTFTYGFGLDSKADVFIFSLLPEILSCFNLLNASKTVKSSTIKFCNDFFFGIQSEDQIHLVNSKLALFLKGKHILESIAMGGKISSKVLNYTLEFIENFRILKKTFTGSSSSSIQNLNSILHEEIHKLMQVLIENLEYLVRKQKVSSISSQNSHYFQIFDFLAGIKEELGLFLLSNCCYFDAEPLLKFTVEEKIKQFGEFSVETSAALNNLAVCLKNNAHLDEAEKCYEKCIVILSTLFGNDNPQLQIAEANLVFAYTANGKIKKAENLFKSCFDIFSKKGKETCTNKSLKANLMQAHPARSNSSEKLNNYPRLSAKLNSSLMNLDLKSIVNGNNHGSSNLDPEENSSLSKKSNELCISPEILAKLYRNFGDAMRDQKKPEKALKYYRIALALSTDSSKDVTNNPEIAKILLSISQLEFEKQNYEVCERTQAEVLQILETHYGKKNVIYATALTSFGNTLCQQGKYDKSLKILKESLEIRKSLEVSKTIPGENSSNSLEIFSKSFLRTLVSIGIVLQKLNQDTEALLNFEEALSICEKLKKEEEFKKLKVIQKEVERNLKIEQEKSSTRKIQQKEMLALKKKFTKVMKSAKKKEHRSSSSPNNSTINELDKQIGEIYFYIAQSYANLRIFKRACFCFFKSYPFFVKSFGKRSKEIGDLFVGWGSALLLLKKYPEAEHCFKMALPVFQEKYGPDHEKTRDIEGNIIELKSLKKTQNCLIQ